MKQFGNRNRCVKELELIFDTFFSFRRLIEDARTNSELTEILD